MTEVKEEAKESRRERREKREKVQTTRFDTDVSSTTYLITLITQVSVKVDLFTIFIIVCVRHITSCVYLFSYFNSFQVMRRQLNFYLLL